jgi:hydrogenase 3 maturation protease
MSTVIVGIGNLLRGDDGAGVAVVRRLRARGRTQARLIEAGTAPENYLGPITQAQPAAVIIVDAADMGRAPGTIADVDVDESGWPSLSTHAPSLQPLVAYLRAETGARVRLIGIQPAARALDAPLSPEVEAAVGRLVQALECGTA